MRSPQPRVFLSDHEDALKSAVSQLLPDVPQLLCVWHINKNVLTKAQREWRDADGKTKEEKEAIANQRSEFMGRWAQIVYSKTEAEFESKWKALQTDYKDQDALCKYLDKNQYPVRHQWARPWTSQHRHYNTTSTSPIEGSHKVLKDYLMTSAGDLLRVVERIGHMVENQYHLYRNAIASARNTIKHTHRLEKMPFLPIGIHHDITPPAIELVRKQDEIRQKYRRERRFLPCTGSFERINDLPCYHTLQSMENVRSSLRMSHFDDDHWRYQRREGHSILPPPPRPYQFVLDPLTVRSRGAPRKSEASTRRDPSAFERRVPARPSTQSQSGVLQEVIRHIDTTTHTTVTSPSGIPVTTVSVSTSETAIYVSSPMPSSSTADRSLSPHDTFPTHGTRLFSPLSSPGARNASSPTLDEASAPQRPVWQPPSLEEFEEDIRRRQLLPVMQECNDPAALTDFLAATGQEDDPEKLVLAREMALDTTGHFADCTPQMAWNWHFGDRSAFYTERAAQARARNPFLEPQSASNRPLKRAAPEDATITMEATKKKKRRRKRSGICHQEGHNSRTCQISNQGPLAVDEEQTIAGSLAIEAPTDVQLAQDAVVVLEATKQQRRCGLCHQEGHNSRTCKVGDGGQSTVQEEQALEDYLDIESESESELAEDAVIVVGVTKKKTRRCGKCHQEGHYATTCQM